jgi:branched-chain amino acid transport system permease protein
MSAWFDYTVNGLIVGNIYALLAVGLALIFGVSHLINFAHGSVYMIGGFIGWLCLTRLGAPLPVALFATVAGCALLGVLIERIGLRPLQGAARIAPLLATIGISFVLDQLAQIIFGPDPRAVPSNLPNWSFSIGGATIGSLDLLIAVIGIASAAVLYVFLRFTRLGWAVRATAQDRDAAQQMGVNVHAVNRVVFAIACGLGGLSGLLVGMYYNSIDPAMGFQATLKGVVALLIGGLGNVPGAIAGSLLLGLVESYGVALFGTSYRDLFAFVLLLVFLVWRPNGLFSSNRRLPPEPLTGTFLANGRALRVPRNAVLAVGVIAFALPLVAPSPYLLQILTNGWIYGLLALSLTLVAGTVGQISLGHAALLLVACGDHSARRRDYCIDRHGLDLSVVSFARPLCVYRDAWHRRDHRTGCAELGQPHARAGWGDRDRTAFAVRLAIDECACGLLVRAGRARAARAIAGAAIAIASGAHVACHSRRRCRRARLWCTPEPLQGNRLCMRWLCRRHWWRNIRAPV